MFGNEFSSDRRIALILCVGFGAGALLFLLPTFRIDSRVIRRVEMTGRIIMIQPGPVNPKGIVGQGLHYKYTVELPDGRKINISDSAKVHHRMHSPVQIERSTRENGTQFYAFSRPGNAYVPGL